ncbi:MAG: hypothetical protein O7H40_14220, partial [Gammaproteobacteria bacterium]|nr:hypothetical protein [Gammaproteobacteria bacterium]
LALLASCAASGGWTRSNTSQAQMDQDVSECTMQADAMTMSAAAGDCSRLTGTTTGSSLGVQAPGADPARFGERQVAFTNCMTARRYTRGWS